QGKHYTDVNHVSTLMAEKLGGHSYQIHAPLFADDAGQRAMLMNMRSVAEVFQRAREAKIAVVGIGSIVSTDSTYYDLHPSSSGDRTAIEHSGASAELLAHLLDVEGRICDYSLNRALVSLTLDEFAHIPTKIGVASGLNKAESILSVLRGNHLDTLVTDEATGARILELASQEGYSA
ncbi:MAG TPA: Crp/Fnr family transcriptional regulator, partial [Ochrobactrum anthropi]|nr:Crp/Fnr family transcriptional regulator [Brucella anthropi]